MISDQTHEQIEIVGWRYESYTEDCEAWTTVTTLSLTAPEIRKQAGRIRRLTPLMAFENHIAAHWTGREVEQGMESNRNE